MPSAKEAVYSFAGLDEYPLKDRIAIRAINVLCFVLLTVIGPTIRFEIEGWENYEKVIAGGRLPVWATWHDRIVTSLFHLKYSGIVVMASRSKDGEYIARLVQRFGFGVVRGSSSRGAARALIEMRRIMAAGKETLFTVDGPRGPRYVAKPGPVYLAKLTGGPILPFMVEPKSCWTLNTWDKLQIPRPFSKALFRIAEPVDVPPDASEETIAAKIGEMQASLDGLVARGLEWSSRRAE